MCSRSCLLSAFACSGCWWHTHKLIGLIVDSGLRMKIEISIYFLRPRYINADAIAGWSPVFSQSRCIRRSTCITHHPRPIIHDESWVSRHGVIVHPSCILYCIWRVKYDLWLFPNSSACILNHQSSTNILSMSNDQPSIIRHRHLFSIIPNMTYHQL